jgi:UDP-N-acetylglucosamine transferase subunit ALG13
VILVTVGTMLPFDRLVLAMDRWAAKHPSDEVFAQIGQGSFEPRTMTWTRLLPPQEFAALARRAALIVAHAGTGSYFLAAEISRPVVMLPRLAANREHTTDHQLHTAAWLRGKPGVYIALSEEELPPAIAQALEQGSDSVRRFPPYAPDPFLSRVREFLAVAHGRGSAPIPTKEAPDDPRRSRRPWQDGPLAPGDRQVPS